MVPRRHSADKCTCSIVVMATTATDGSSQSATLNCHDITLVDDTDNPPVANKKDNTEDMLKFISST